MMNYKKFPIPENETLSKKEQVKNELVFSAEVIKDSITGAFKKPLPPERTGSKRPVVIVPGWISRTHIFKNLQKAIHDQGHPVYVLPLGFQTGNILKKSKKLSEFLDQNQLKDVYIVAHSMGGLISMGSMLLGETRIRKAWTLGTPFWGTYLAFIPFMIGLIIAVAGVINDNNIMLLFLSIFTMPSLKQMLPGSDILQLYKAHYYKQPNIQCIFASFDQIVVTSLLKPTTPAALGMEDDTCLPEFGHLNLFMGKNGVKCILHHLDVEEAKS